MQSFCTAAQVTTSDMEMRLRLLAASLTGVQGTDLTILRLRVERLQQILSSALACPPPYQWYLDEFKDGYGFRTYRPEVIPNAILEELKYRDTGNAFLNFGADVLKLPPIPTAAFSTSRPSASETSNWLGRGKDNATIIL